MKEDSRQDKYIPALGYDWLTFLYDPVVRLTTREATFKAALIKQAQIQAGHRVLDLGCGTATLTIAIKQAYPQAEVRGLDGDAKILRRAVSKAKKSDVKIMFKEGLSYSLPYADASFDRVVSSLFFHHLTRENKLRTLAEVWRVLKVGGQLHIADWGAAHNKLMRGLFFQIQWFDGYETTTDNLKGLLPRLMQESGFQAIQEEAHYATMFGTLALHSAKKSEM